MANLAKNLLRDVARQSFLEKNANMIEAKRKINRELYLKNEHEAKKLLAINPLYFDDETLAYLNQLGIT